MLKRAAAAIREARSNDTVVLAKVALSAAIRNEVDLLELLPDPRGPSRRRANRSARQPPSKFTHYHDQGRLKILRVAFRMICPATGRGKTP
jgi:hypothetical protein